jgi:hypothetical protein
VKGIKDKDTSVVPCVFPCTNATCAPKLASDQKRGDRRQLAKGDREANGVEGVKDEDANVVPRIFPSTNATCTPELTSDRKRRLMKNQKRAARRKWRKEHLQLAEGDREADGEKGIKDMDANVVPRIFPSTNATCSPALTSD